MLGVNAMKFYLLRCNSIYYVKLYKVIKIYDYIFSFIFLLGISNIELYDFCLFIFDEMILIFILIEKYSK